MALSDAERQRRSRRHRRGDHELCDPLRCPALVAGADQGPVTAVTAAVMSRGQRLWAELTVAGHQLGPAALVLAQEACRIVDRLDKLHSQLEEGTNWLQVETGEDITQVTVLVDQALAETRQQAVALKGIFTELRQATSRHPVSAASKEAAGIGDLTARIAARQGSSAG